MKNRFTITITDVHGSKDYSFNQFVKKFVRYFLLFILLLITSGSLAIWWLTDRAEKIKQQSLETQVEQQRQIDEKQRQYELLNHAKHKLQRDFDKAKLTLEVELGEKTKQLFVLEQTLESLEELLGVEAEEKQSVADRAKVAQLTTIEKQLTLEMFPNGRPVREFKGVSSSYGWRKHPVTGKRDFHDGIDYRGKKGDIIISPADGIVEYSGYNKKSGYGNLIIVVHSGGFKTLYGHMSKRLVKKGELVLKGQAIGHIGSTGLSSGPHLHYEVSFLHKKLNPAHFVSWNIKDYDPIFTKVKGVPWGSLTQRIKKRVQKVEKQLLLQDVK